jgi:hypothetical protein
MIAAVDRRFQVFISSTYTDLAEERAEVVSMLLNLDAFPAGMELFPATNDDAWTLIQQVIDESDYYLLVVGGRYGSVDDETQLSYTEREFDYALSNRKPVMAFLHGDTGKIPSEKTDQSDAAREKLDALRKKVEDAVHVNYWTGSDELGGLVAKSFVKIQKSHPAVGWLRGDVQTSTESLEELNALRKRAEDAETKLDAARRGPPPGTEDLSQGQDKIRLPVMVTAQVDQFPYDSQREVMEEATTSWDSLFGAVGPALFDEADQATMKDKLDLWLFNEVFDSAADQVERLAVKTRERLEIREGQLLADDFDTVLVQLSALGLITRSERKRSLKDTGTYWTLTPFGEEHLRALRAIRKSAKPAEPATSAG